MGQYRPTVYVVQEHPRGETSAAEAYGNVVTILRRDEEITPRSMYGITKKLTNVLQHYRPNDYLICIGNPVAIGMAFAIAADFGHGVVRVLKWDKKRERYDELLVDLEAIFQERAG